MKNSKSKNKTQSQKKEAQISNNNLPCKKSLPPKEISWRKIIPSKGTTLEKNRNKFLTNMKSLNKNKRSKKSKLFLKEKNHLKVTTKMNRKKRLNLKRSPIEWAERSHTKNKILWRITNSVNKK